MMQKHAIALMLGTMMWVGLTAQMQVRPDDHFWKRRVVNRIPLNEKINQPYVVHEATYYGNSSSFRENDGLVASLLNGLKDGRYLAYDPYDWEQVMTYEQVFARMVENEQALGVADDYTTEASGGMSDMEMFERAESESDEWEDYWDGSSEGEAEETWEDEDMWGSTTEGAPISPVTAEPTAKEIDLYPYEQVFHLVEDWIFDKNRSMMVQEIDFIEIIWVDPSGSLPESILARFKWRDVLTQLQQTQWKNRHNDAMSHSVAQALKLRLFHGFFINVGGNGVQTVWEADRRRQEIVEFEHHLWSY